MSKITKVIKEIKNNNLLIKKEKYLNLYKSIYNNLNIPFFIRQKIYFTYIQPNYVKKLKRSCILSKNYRSKYSFFNISRIKIRDLMSFKNLTGIRKSSW